MSTRKNRVRKMVVTGAMLLVSVGIPVMAQAQNPRSDLVAPLAGGAAGTIVEHAAGALVGGVVGATVGHLADPPSTVEEQTEMNQRDAQVYQNQQDHGTSTYQAPDPGPSPDESSASDSSGGDDGDD